MKRIILSLFALAASFCMNAQVQQRAPFDWNDHFVISPYNKKYEFKVSYLKNNYSHGSKYEFDECFGYAIIPNIGNGLLIYHDGLSKGYFAYDMGCPKCRRKLHMVNYMTVGCENCSSQFTNISNGTGTQTNMEQQYALTQYLVREHNGYLLITR